MVLQEGRLPGVREVDAGEVSGETSGHRSQRKQTASVRPVNTRDRAVLWAEEGKEEKFSPRDGPALPLSTTLEVEERGSVHH